METTEHCVSHYVPEVIKTKSKMLMYLEYHKADLQVGDLVVSGERSLSNDDVYIYDGEELLDLDFSIDRNGALPSKFHVIDNGVPANYWSHSYKGNLKGIADCNIVWFDHVPVRDQCIANLIVDPTDAKKPRNHISHSFTKFFYTDDPKPYYIFFRNNTKEQMLKILKSDEIIFEHMNHPRNLVTYLPFKEDEY